MTVEHEANQEPEPESASDAFVNPPLPPYPPVTPLVPRPVVTIIALLVSFALVGHLFYDAFDEDYDGWRVTGALGLLVFFVLGGDVSKWLRRGG